MSTFEYLAIAYSLLFSVTALRLVGGFSHILKPESRYWVHSSAVLLVLAGLVQNFWTFLSYREIEWTYFKFLSMLAIPGALYFIATMLIPDEPGNVESWKTHYFEKRIPYFIGIVVWGLMTFLNTTFVQGMDIFHPVRIVQFGLVLLGVLGLCSAKALLHQFLVATGCVLVVLMATVVVFLS